MVAGDTNAEQIGKIAESQTAFDDQWRSFQTFVAAYLAGMLDPRDFFTISRRRATGPASVEFGCGEDGTLRCITRCGDEAGESVPVRREDADRYARETVRWLRGLDGVDEPGALRLRGTCPASSVSALASGGFMRLGPDGADPARRAALAARMTANIDTEGDVIQAAARAAGSEAFRATGSGSIAAIVAAKKLSELRSWVDLFEE